MAVNTIRIYLGYDSREDEAYRVAEHSIRSRASVPVSITPLKLERFTEQGLLRRPLQKRKGRLFDVISNSNQSTEFAASRFLVPFLAHEGMAIFMDCDVVVLADIAELAALHNPKYAVQVVQQYLIQGPRVKMDDQEQAHYARKNWSSVVMWSVDHPAHRRLTIDGVNGCRGLDLHQFWWLKDEEIGALPEEWNVLVNVQPMPETPKILHYTMGGPWLPDWKPAAHDEIWLKERKGLK